jgi:ABC-2 type transport system ATP-binding protein
MIKSRRRAAAPRAVNSAPAVPSAPPDKGAAPAVIFEGVSKTWSSGLFRSPVRAVQDVTLRIPTSQVFGLLGPNRAGKTTLIKMLLSLTTPTAGSITRLGQPVSARSTLGRVGYMHENHAFPRHLSATELLHFYGALSLMPFERIAPQVKTLLARVGLADRCHEPITRFSKGMVQRLGLAQALLSEPDLLVLDEPTEGLDLQGRQLLREIVAETRAQGRTVLLVSHVLTEVEQLCDRVAVLVNSRLIHEGPLAELIRDPLTGAPRSLEQALQPLYEKAVS